jgi:hypothetical protein
MLTQTSLLLCFKNKLMRKLLALVAVLVLFATSCKKDDASNVQGKWNISKVVELDVFAGGTDTDEWSFPGDYFNFKSGGSFEGQFDGDPISGSWAMDGGSKVNITVAGITESMTIKSSTSSSLVLSSRDGNSTDYSETTIYLQK